MKLLFRCNNYLLATYICIELNKYAVDKTGSEEETAVKYIDGDEQGIKFLINIKEK